MTVRDQTIPPKLSKCPEVVQHGPVPRPGRFLGLGAISVSTRTLSGDGGNLISGCRSGSQGVPCLLKGGSRHGQHGVCKLVEIVTRAGVADDADRPARLAVDAADNAQDTSCVH